MLEFFGLTNEYVDTLSVSLACTPDSGTLPFATPLAVSIQNLTDQSRVMAVHLDTDGAAFEVFGIQP